MRLLEGRGPLLLHEDVTKGCSFSIKRDGWVLFYIVLVHLNVCHKMQAICVKES
jgi:hypothetical protein